MGLAIGYGNVPIARKPAYPASRRFGLTCQLATRRRTWRVGHAVFSKGRNGFAVVPLYCLPVRGACRARPKVSLSLGVNCNYLVSHVGTPLVGYVATCYRYMIARTYVHASIKL